MNGGREVELHTTPLDIAIVARDIIRETLDRQLPASHCPISKNSTF